MTTQISVCLKFLTESDHQKETSFPFFVFPESLLVYSKSKITQFTS